MVSQPRFLEPDDPVDFPDPNLADPEGLVAVGGDLTVDRLLAAYGAGIFPWYEEAVPPLWWSPDPRGVLRAELLHVSRSLHRRLRRGGFELTWNRAFERVMLGCKQNRSDGTWIIPEMVAAYGRLHAAGHAHSLEVWIDGELAGGLYGVQRGGLFAGESMFHTRTDASKIALVSAVRSLARAGVELVDVQFVTDHLARMGAVSWSRRRYLREVARLRDKRLDLRDLAPDWRP